MKNGATYIAAGVVVYGDVEGKGSVHVDGHVQGSLLIDGEAYVGEQARVAGSVHATDAHVAGLVEGGVRATGHVEVLSGAVVHGSVRGVSVKVQQGADTRGGVGLLARDGGESQPPQPAPHAAGRPARDVSGPKQPPSSQASHEPADPEEAPPNENVAGMAHGARPVVPRLGRRRGRWRATRPTK